MKKKALLIFAACMMLFAVLSVSACVPGGRPGASFLEWLRGADGQSAFDIWLEAGNEGTEADFLAWLQGAAGQSGADGQSAFEIWLAQGNEGTEADFLEWLRRPPETPQRAILSFEGTDFLCVTLPGGTVVWQPANPTDNEREFLGWYLDAARSVRAFFPFVLEEDVVLYASWGLPDTITFFMVSAGEDHSLAIDAGGNLWAWGWNWSGQIGDGTTLTRHRPVQIMPGSLFSYVSAGQGHSFAIDAGGNLWAWGWNWHGQLGDGTMTERHSPVRIMQGTLFTRISASASHNLAIDSERGLWAWGFNGDGRVGDGTTLTRHSPVRVMQGTLFSHISAGVFHSLAIDAGGSLWSWGQNTYGQLGSGTRIHRLTPSRIMQDTLFLSISAGNQHSVAVDDGGNLWGWGDNRSMQLGEGGRLEGNIFAPDRLSPVLIKQSQAVLFSFVSAGSGHNLAVDIDGNLWSWGSNSWGQLGDGTFVSYRYTPVQIMTGVSLSFISAGATHNHAIDSDGNLWAWGSNISGQLGDDTSWTRRLPVRITAG